MDFIKHYNLEGLHAPFSASQSAWLRYDDEKAKEAYERKKSAERGTRLHAWAKETIDLGIKQPKSKKTLYEYVNDAIGFKMATEVVLFYTERFFGTADAISFRRNPKTGRNILRIHDLKTGVVGKADTHIEQLSVYAALFCLEYKFKPTEIDMELRVYKKDEVVFCEPDPEAITTIMNKIIHLDKLLAKIDNEEVL
jgi:hypothetical protein